MVQCTTYNFQEKNMAFNQEELTKLTQKNIARGFKTSQAMLKGAEQLLQLQINYIRQSFDEQAKFAQQFDAGTLAQDISALQQTRTQRMVQVGKEAFHIASDVQADIRQITDEQQREAQKEVNAVVDNFSPAAYFDPALLQKTFEQFWANTTTAFDTLKRFTQTTTEEAKKTASASTTAKTKE
jgi:phasin family protein